MTEYTPDFHKIFGVRKPKDFGGYPMPGMRKNLDVAVDPDGPINPGGEANTRTQELSELADEDTGPDDDDEITGKGSTMKSQLIDLAKRSGWRALCKHFVENGTGSFSETEVTGLLTAVARKMHPDLKPDVAFAKAYSAQTPDGELMRRTTMAARDAGFVSRTTTMAKQCSSAAFHAGDSPPEVQPGRATLRPRLGNPESVNNPKTALQALAELTAEQMRQKPAMSENQAFARVYEDKANAELVRREREENRPVATGW
jgi:hypothetical protein